MNDPLDLLRAAAPEHHRLDPGDDPAADAMLQNILATSPTAPVRRRRRRRCAVAAAVRVATASAGTVAAIVLTRDKPDALMTVACWNEAEVQPDEVIVVPWDGTDPIETCTPLWEQDRFDTVETNEAPPLVACVNATGGLVVEPGEVTVCEKLGLAEYDDTPDDEISQTRSAVEEIESTVTEAACLSAADAALAIGITLAGAQSAAASASADAATDQYATFEGEVIDMSADRSGTGHSGGVTSIYARGTWINLSTYGADNTTSSYKVGACSAAYRSGNFGTGSNYPGSTSAYAQSTSMVSGWNNVVSSVRLS